MLKQDDSMIGALSNQVGVQKRQRSINQKWKSGLKCICEIFSSVCDFDFPLLRS